MSELHQRLRHATEISLRFLRLARLLPPWPLLLLSPLLGGVVLAGKGAAGFATLFALLLAGLALWGVGVCNNDLANLRRGDQQHSLVAQGVVPARQAFWFALLLGAIALLLFALLGLRVVALASLPLLVALTFPLLRRRTYLIDAWLGLGIAWSVPLAYGALQQWPDKSGALLGVITLLWATAWSVLRAWPAQSEMVERGVRTLGLMFGPATGHLVVALQFTMLLGGWMAAGQESLGSLYGWGLAASALLVAAESWLILSRGSRSAELALRLHLLSGAVLWLGVVLHVATA